MSFIRTFYNTAYQLYLKQPTPVQKERQPIISKKEIDLKNLLKTPPPIRDLILKGVSYTDMIALNIALGTGRRLETEYKENFKSLINQITPQIKYFKANQPLLKEILTNHPEWKSQVSAWKNVSLEDKVWLLQLRELRILGVDIPQIDGLRKNAQPTDLLKCNERKAIIEALSKVETLQCDGKNLRKCPKAIRLLVNLQHLYLLRNELTVPPDVSGNVHLKTLSLDENQLTVAPDVQYNVNLETFSLASNRLTVPPNLSKNVNLLNLYLNNNQLTAPPDVNGHINLRVLSLDFNKLTRAPDVSRNANLLVFGISNNQLTAPPDVRQNVNLKVFGLSNNLLTTPPDVSQNVKLKELDLENNKLKISPDVSQNTLLNLLRLHGNPLYIPIKEAGAKILQRTREKIHQFE